MADLTTANWLASHSEIEHTEQSVQRSCYRSECRRSVFGLAFTVLFGVAGIASPHAVVAREAETVAAGQSIAVSSLPREAQQTHQHIYSGGPFTYTKDGAVFSNRERHLVRQPRGYYREYTVPTVSRSGVSSRGARRIVCGGSRPTAPDACFYTEDHYNSFLRIVK